MKTLILFSCLAMFGCESNKPSAKNNYYTDYSVSQNYVLKQPIFLSTKTGFLIKIGNGGLGSVPNSLEEFLKNPTVWDVDLLPKGTELKISQIKYTSSFDAGPYIWIYADVMSGQLSGKKCLISPISKQIHKTEPLITVPMVDTNILEML